MDSTVINKYILPQHFSVPRANAMQYLQYTDLLNLKNICILHSGATTNAWLSALHIPYLKSWG